jgi:cell division protein FtsN
MQDLPVALDEAAVPAQAAPNELSYAEALQGEGPAAVPPPPIDEAPAAEPNAGNAAAPPPAAAERAEAPPAPKAAGPPPVDGWVVQVGAFTANDVATREVAKLQAKGYPAFVFSEPPGVPGPRYKVRVGPYSARTDADQMLRDLTNEGYQPLLRR